MHFGKELTTSSVSNATINHQLIQRYNATCKSRPQDWNHFILFLFHWKPAPVPKFKTSHYWVICQFLFSKPSLTLYLVEITVTWWNIQTVNKPTWNRTKHVKTKRLTHHYIYVHIILILMKSNCVMATKTEEPLLEATWWRNVFILTEHLAHTA